MTEVRQRVPIALPAQTAQERVMEYFELFRDADGKIRFPVRLRVANGEHANRLVIEHDVDALVERHRDDSGVNDEIRLSWHAPARALPSFSGRIYAYGEDDPFESTLEVDGRYEPPLGAGGQAFDALLGHRVAENTLRDVLLRIRDGIRRS